MVGRVRVYPSTAAVSVSVSAAPSPDVPGGWGRCPIPWRIVHRFQDTPDILQRRGRAGCPAIIMANKWEVRCFLSSARCSASFLPVIVLTARAIVAVIVSDVLLIGGNRAPYFPIDWPLFREAIRVFPKSNGFTLHEDTRCGRILPVPLTRSSGLSNIESPFSAALFDRTMEYADFQKIPRWC